MANLVTLKGSVIYVVPTVPSHPKQSNQEVIVPLSGVNISMSCVQENNDTKQVAKGKNTF